MVEIEKWRPSVVLKTIMFTFCDMSRVHDVVSYLLLLHRLFVRFLHLVHLNSHVGFLVLKVCFELCELEEKLIINMSNTQQTVMRLCQARLITYLSVLFENGLIPLLQKSLQ